LFQWSMISCSQSEDAFCPGGIESYNLTGELVGSW
jgi:hypothetical protein